jgi:hypothetical protein
MFNEPAFGNSSSAFANNGSRSDSSPFSFDEVFPQIEKALQLNHGSGFGPTFYRRQARAELMRTVQQLSASSLKELLNCLPASRLTSGPVQLCRGPKHSKRTRKERK